MWCPTAAAVGHKMTPAEAGSGAIGKLKLAPMGRCPGRCPGLGWSALWAYRM